MTLEENDTDHCNFKILPINNLRNIGDVVSYSDIINLVSCAEENYYFHIASELILLNSSPEKQIPIEETLSNGLEVNGSEIQTNLKVNCYLNYTENKKNEEITTKFLLNGDIITIFNRETGGVLTVAPRNVKEYFIEKPVLISSGDDKHGHQAQNSFMIQFLRSDNVTESDEKLGVFIQKAAKELDQKSFNSLWEVQRKKTFDGSVLDLSESFRLKNIATGLFLSVNKAGKPELLNTAGNIKGRDSNCYFTFVSKFMTNEQENTIKYDESLKIKVSDSHSCFLGYGEVLCPISFSVFFSDRKGDSTKFLFELKSSDQKSRNFADRISSLVPYLMKFYTFLQSFGMLEERNKQRNNEESFRYDYERALHQEKDLENEIKQLFESLQNLNNFLQVKINQEDETMFRMRQNILNDQKILELLIAITHLIDQMCRGNVLHLDPKGNLSLIHSTSISAIKKQDRQGSSYKNLDKTPFAIAKKHLERPMKAIFEFLYFSIKGNQKSSQFILEFDDFFKNQLKFYFREISMLLKEAIRCAFLLKKNDIYGNQLLEWIKLLENLNEMSKNIENQALYLELIACALIDAYDCPVTRYQEKSLQELFSVQQGKKLRLLRFNIMVDKAGKERAVISFPKDGIFYLSSF